MAANIFFHPGKLLIMNICSWLPIRIVDVRGRHKWRTKRSAQTEGGNDLVDRAQCQWKGMQLLFQLPLKTDDCKSTIACALEQHLLHLHKFAYRLDGDNVRFGLNKDLGFDEKSRNENIRRIGEVSACESVVIE